MRLVLALAILSSATFVRAQDIRGVWQPVEVLVVSGPEAGRHTDVQPGLLIVTERHYAYMHVQGFVARPPLGSNPSPETRCSTWEP